VKKGLQFRSTRECPQLSRLNSAFGLNLRALTGRPKLKAFFHSERLRFLFCSKKRRGGEKNHKKKNNKKRGGKNILLSSFHKLPLESYLGGSPPTPLPSFFLALTLARLFFSIFHFFFPFLVVFFFVVFFPPPSLFSAKQKPQAFTVSPAPIKAKCRVEPRKLRALTGRPKLKAFFHSERLRSFGLNRCWADTPTLRAVHPVAHTLVQPSVCDPEGRPSLYLPGSA
jgi:hypothetical protein